MTNKVLSTVLIAMMASAVGVEAQDGAYRYAEATQLWRLTENAAGLGLDYSYDRGFAQFSLQHASGDYTRVQEGSMSNQLEFITERHQKIGRALVGYGKFQFDMGRTKDRAWADEMRPYNANPFISGSSVKGKYDAQTFSLTAALSTLPITLCADRHRTMTLGLQLDYQVGDLSRLRDPRSRAQLLDYRLSPAVTYSFGSSTVGLAGHYNRRKEKLPSLTTVQEDPNLEYFLMSGLEQATGTIGGYKGFSREWVNHELGAQLSYQYHCAGINSLTAAAIARGEEDVWGNYKYEPGRYVSYIYKASSLNRHYLGRLLHQLDVQACFTEAFADEYRQQLVQERDADKGFTSYSYDTQIEYKKRYQVKTADVGLRYRLNVVEGTSADEVPAVKAYVGATATLQGATNKRLLPLSTLEYQRQRLTLEGGYALFSRRLWIDAAATYSSAPKADLSLADATTAYAQQVLQPDMAFYAAHYWQGSLALTYHFPLTIKSTPTRWYLRAYADCLKASGSLDRTQLGVALGTNL